MDRFFQHAKAELFPKVQDSAFSVTILHSKPDPKLCMELGALILFDKPIVLLIPDQEMLIPANLARVASAIVYGQPSDPETQRKLQDAITATLDTDKRLRP